MTTQVRPLSGGGWNTASTNADKTIRKSTTLGVSLPAGQTLLAWFALEQWLNCAGVGTHAVLAQKRAKAAGLQLQEV